ncbi:hypothetical protein Slin15195_G078650 [Septoria linicola]|uniref:Uncharacterized protein n=1 Tax=Septoria linicola TaxID=215465 RepID=A0A9Q9AZE9_9PEZI|nr:hypothetical protein Slin14017_G039850 [Septoria linicola]USW54546.1 hypothetical protein Slin15195_G078650 [Septoria linicola]
MVSLNETQLEEFWLPYTAHLLVTVTTITLRCFLESADLAMRLACASKLVLLRDRLKLARQESGWDLANFCLDRCSETIDRISSAAGNHNPDMRLSASQHATAQGANRWTDFTFEQLSSELLRPMDSLQYPFNHIWDI